MRPILLQGHERSITQIVYNSEGDLLFSTSKDHVINVWFSHNGERLGTYNGHVGAIWTVSVNKDSTILASGSADNTIKLWNIQTGACLKTWEFPTAVKRVAFSEDDEFLLGVTEKRMGYPGSIVIFPITNDISAAGAASSQVDDPTLTITNTDSKATVAGWSYLNKFIIAGHENGSVSQYDAKSGERLHNEQVHAATITDLQMSLDGTYCITASKDKTASIIDANTLEVRKTYESDTPLNTAAITPRQDLVVLGGGQEAMNVTTTGARQGKFEARFYHKIFEEEVGRVRGHFGPLNTIAVHPKGTGYASGGEDGYVRVHAFDESYFKFKYNV